MRSTFASAYSRVLDHLQASDLRDISSNIGWLFFDRVLKMGVSLFVGVWVARYLGPENFGHLSYAIALVAIFGSLAALGLDLVVVRDLVKAPASKDEILGTALSLKLVGGVVSAAGTVMIATLLLPQRGPEFWLVIIMSGSLLAKSWDVIDFFFQAEVRSKYTVVAKNLAFLLLASIKIALIIAGAPLLAFGWAYLAEFIAAAIGLSIAYHVFGFRFVRWRFDVGRAIHMLRDGLPGIGAAVSVVLYMKLDQVMLGELASAAEVGNYAVAARLSEVTYFLPVIITSSLMPSFVKLRTRDPEGYQARLQTTYDFMVVAGLVLVVPLSLAAPLIVRLLYGPEYSAAGQVLQIYAWSFLFIAFSVTTGKWLYAEDLIPYNFVLQASGAVTNIFLNFLLIPLVGGKGAAVATLISYGVASYLALLPFSALRPAFIRISKAIFLPVRWTLAILTPRGS